MKRRNRRTGAVRRRGGGDGAAAPAIGADSRDLSAGARGSLAPGVQQRSPLPCWPPLLLLLLLLQEGVI